MYDYHTLGTNGQYIDNKRNDHKQVYILPLVYSTPGIPYNLDGCII